MPRRQQPDVLAAAVGARVRAFREARGARLEEVAFESGLTSKGHLSDLEHGRVVPTIGTLQAVAEQLGVDLLDLVTFPARSARQRLVERTRGLPEHVIARWLDEADALGPSAVDTPGIRSSGTRGVQTREVEIVRGERAPRGGVPVVDLEAHAGRLGAGRTVEPVGWVRIDPRSRALPGAFVARVLGASMEPRVPSGAYCLFRRPAPGNRRGRVFLVQHRDDGAPEDGGAYVLKLVERSVEHGEERVVLRSLNPAFAPQVLDPVREEVQIVAELVRVLPVRTSAAR